jgi:proline dehydrogenase
MGSAWDSTKQFVVHRLTPPFLVKVFARPYVAGDSIDSALHTAADLTRTRGLHTTLDILGEEVASEPEITRQVDHYLRLVERIGDPDRCSISVKPSAMGLRLDEDLAAKNMGRIVDAAARAGVATTIDMEDHTLTTATLRLHRRLRERHSAERVGTVLQSRLFRTPEDIAALADLPSRIRLVIGIYKEPAEVALTRKRAIKEQFLVQLEQLIDGGHRVEVATHDEQLLIYVPFADNWADAIAYCKRRMVENPSMAGMVLKNLFSPGTNGASE